MSAQRFRELVEEEANLIRALREVASDLSTGNEPDITVATTNAAKRHDVWPPALYLRTIELAQRAGLLPRSKR